MSELLGPNGAVELRGNMVHTVIYANDFDGTRRIISDFAITVTDFLIWHHRNQAVADQIAARVHGQVIEVNFARPAPAHADTA